MSVKISTYQQILFRNDCNNELVFLLGEKEVAIIEANEKKRISNCEFDMIKCGESFKAFNGDNPTNGIQTIIFSLGRTGKILHKAQ
jgi:hypothetical protein